MHHTLQVTNPGTEELRFGIGFHPAFNVPFDEKHTTTDYEFRFDQPESPVILDASPNGLLSGKSYYQWKNQQAIPLTDDLFANDSFCMAGLRTGTIGICEKDTGRNITCRVEGYPIRSSGQLPQSRCALCALSRGTACPPLPPTRRTGSSAPQPPALPPAKAGRPPLAPPLTGKKKARRNETACS